LRLFGLAHIVRLLSEDFPACDGEFPLVKRVHCGASFIRGFQIKAT
jgi:hypothetical protein